MGYKKHLFDSELGSFWYDQADQDPYLIWDGSYV